jgi:hypothetical protein
MAGKTLNRKELRAQVEAAERSGEKTATPSPKKSATGTKRKSRAKEPVDVRVKLYWGVFNQSLKRVALYEFNQKKQADQKAEALTAQGKSPHFVKKVKEAVEE